MVEKIPRKKHEAGPGKLMQTAFERWWSGITFNEAQGNKGGGASAVCVCSATIVCSG